VLLDGDIVNLDISIYHGGYHADLNETYYVGDKAKADPDNVRLVETTREALDLAIAIVKPGVPIRDFGKVIEKHATSRNLVVIKTWGGHGINSEFHPPPWIPHYAKNKAVGTCKPGMTFTIEPILALGRDKEVHWPDNWTNVTVDGKWSAQFGKHRTRTENMLVLLTLLDCRTYLACYRDWRRGFDGKIGRFSGWTDCYSRSSRWWCKELILRVFFW
jgi:methionyl aminopeptidase